MRATLASIFVLSVWLTPMLHAWAQDSHQHSHQHSQAAASTAASSPSASKALVPPVSDWRATIDRVQRAGGWKAYLREAQQPTASAQTPAAILRLEEAIRLTLEQHPDLIQRLVGIDLAAPDWRRLSAEQRQALVTRQRLIHAVKTQFYLAQSTQEWAAIQAEVYEINAIATELSTRMRKAGNLNALHLIEEQLKAESALHATVQAHDRAVQEQEHLRQIMGFAAKLPALERPTDLRQHPIATNSVRTQLEQRLNELAQTEPAPDLLARLSQAQQALSRHAMRAQQVEQYQHKILPLRKQLLDEAVLHYNGMIIGIFDLLKEAEHQVQSVQKYLNASADLLRSESELDLELTLLNAHLAQIGRAL